MSSTVTELSRARVNFLLQSPWPTLTTEVDAWLRRAPEGSPVDPPSGVPVTPVTLNTHEGMVAGFSWFASYSDATQLTAAHDELSELISTLLESPGLLERGGGGHSGYWATPKFAVETYAHVISDRVDPRILEATLQVNVADATLAASQEAIARRSL